MKTNRLNQLWSKAWPYLFFVAVITVMIFPQLKTGLLTSGTDRFFHFSRFYDTAMQIKFHNISPFQTNYGFHQSGRVINALYGPGFAYLNGIILLVMKNWYNYQIFMDYFICLLGASTMFYLLRYLKINKICSVFLSIIYINIGMIPTFINGSTFNGWGQAWMPMVLVCGIRTLKNKEMPINWLQLAIIMSIMIQIHTLSALMAVIMLVPFFLTYLFINKNCKNIWIDLLKAVIGTLVLTANVWGGYLVILLSNKIASPDAFDLRLGRVQLINYRGYHGVYGTVSNHILPMAMCLFVLQFLFVICKFKQDFINTFVSFFGIFVLAVSSLYFPWGIVEKYFPFTQSFFQFPYRLTVIAYPLLIVGVGLTFQNNFVQVNWKKYTYLLLIGFVILESVISTKRTTSNFLINKTRTSRVQRASRTSDLSKIFVNKVYGRQSDYLPVSKDYIPGKMNDMYKKKVVKRYKKFKHYVINHNQLMIEWQAKKKKKIILPLVMYSQSKLMINNKPFNGTKNQIGNPIVVQKKGINTGILSFKTPLYFYIMSFITAISWFVLLIFGLYKFYRGVIDEQKS